jgi:hypothetical protein
MATSIGRGIVVLVAVALNTGAFGQVASDEPITTAIHISGRIVASTGAGIPNRIVTFRNVTTDGRLQDSKLKTDEKGTFHFSATRGVVYQINLTVAEDALLFRGIGTIQVVEGQDVVMGDTVLELSPRNGPMVHLVGPVRIQGRVGTSAPTFTAIAAVCIACSAVPNEFCAGSTVHVVHGDGKEVQPPTDKDQVGISSALISEDKRTAGGWWTTETAVRLIRYP